MHNDKANYVANHASVNSRMLVVTGCLLTALIIGFTLIAPKLTRKEPSHLGKPLSIWIEELRTDRFDWARLEPVIDEKAAGAIRAIGEPAVPFLNSWLERSLNIERFDHLIDALPIDFPDMRSASGRKGYDSALGLTVLGGNAFAAIPTMTNLLFNESTALLAAWVLASIGSASVPALSNALIGTNSKISAAVVHSSGALGKSGEPLIPLLVKVFTNTRQDRVTRCSAARALGMIGQAPKTVLPVLEAGLRDDDHIARRGAAFGLLLMDRHSTSLIPALETALKTPSSKLDQWILMALDGVNADDLGVARALEKSFTFGVSNSPTRQADAGLVVNPEWARVFTAFRTITNITSQELGAAREALVRIAPQEGIE
ncbi:MAG: HEAT repeat domain-containing protein [Pedosphaera sp.]|nr:HEAT repeat domain-containing protein [Pedosphaera sp.]